MASVGSVRSFFPDEGWGVIDGPDVPGGCWVLFSAIAADGYRQLAVGERVCFIAEAVSQDGFDFRAVKVWTGDVEPRLAEPAPNESAPDESGAYHSSLTLTFDGPAD